MTEFSDSLSKSFTKQPKWLQFAANRLLEKNSIEFEDIQEFTHLCQQEAKGLLNDLKTNFPVDVQQIQSVESGTGEPYLMLLPQGYP